MKKNLLPKGLSRNVFALGSVSFFTDLSREMIYPLLPLYLNSVLGASTTFVGLVEGIAESTSSVLNLLSGWLSDKISRKKSLMLIGYGLSSITRPLIALATAGWHILVVRFVEKVGKGIRVPPRDLLIAESSTSENRGRNFGLHRSLDNMGSILGPLVAFALLAYLKNDYRTFFWIAALPAFLALGILSLGVSERGKSPSEMEPAPVKRRFQFSQYGTGFKTFLVATTVFELANSSNAFLLLRVKDMGLSLELIPIIYLFSNLFKTASSLPGGMLSDRLGRRNLLACGWLAYGASYIWFGFAASLAQVWIIFGLYGLFSGMTEGIKKALVADLVPREVRGSAYGLHGFFTKLPRLPASLLLGFLWQKYTAVLAFSIGGSLAIMAGGLLVLFVPRESRETTD